MHVAPPRSATWRPRPEALFARHGTTPRAIGFYRRMCDAAPGIFAGIRALGARWRSRFEKARSDTQSPSALERFLEDLIVLRAAGVPTARLREAGIEIQQFIGGMDPDRAATDAARLLEVLQRANEAEAAANVLQRQLVSRPHRRLDEGDVDAMLEALRKEVAAETELLDVASAFLREARAARHRLAIVPGGRA